jgi:hypothetical protein
VRCYPEDEWRTMVIEAGFEVEQLEHFPRRQSFDAWLARVETPPEAAAQIRDLLAGEIDEDGTLGFQSIVLKARRSQK